MAIADPPDTDTSPTVAQRIWSDPTCLLLIFAGGSAEFAVHPNGRFISTIDYLRQMLVVSAEQREPLAKALRGLHRDIEEHRGGQIPDVAYRDVLSMDIYYSIVAAEWVYGKAFDSRQRDEVVAEMVMFGAQMGIPNLPSSYLELCQMRQKRFESYHQSEFTDRLLKSYRRALGLVGYHSLLGTYPLLLEDELWSKMPFRRPLLSSVLKSTLHPLWRTGLINLGYRIGLPKRLRGVVKTWQSSCADK